MTTGSCFLNNIVLDGEGPSLNQLEDVEIVSEQHNNIFRFNDSVTDPVYSDGFVNKTFQSIENVTDVISSSNPNHDQLFTYNNNIIENSIATGWVEKNITDIIESFQVTIEGLIAIKQSLRNGLNGNCGLSDCVAFTDRVENGNTMTIGSAGNNNVIFKRESTDSDFVFLTVLSKGEIYNMQFSAGTIFRSTKGIVGFSGPFPVPFGIASLSSNYFRFFALRNSVFIYATSAGLESVVTLYASDETTIVDGPVTIPPYGSTTLACNSNSEFVIKSTTDVYCGSSGARIGNTPDNIDHRLVPPMQNEIIVWNRNCRITARELGTTVRWYRRNGDTGIFTINAGTPVNIFTGTINEEVGPNNAGNTADYGVNGCLILRANKPISGFSGADSAGWEATPAWPLNQLSQVFANPSNINDNADFGRSSVTIGSPYEGNATVYSSTGVILATFSITRSVSPATTSDEQLYPASGQWQPLNSGLTDWLGGWVEVNVPSICIMNFDGISGTWTSNAGDEMVIPGVTPEDIRAEIITDGNGLLRRRDIDGSGVETWNVC